MIPAKENNNHFLLFFFFLKKRKIKKTELLDDYLCKPLRRYGMLAYIWLMLVTSII